MTTLQPLVQVRTDDLQDIALDWAVSDCEGYSLTSDGISLVLERGKEWRFLGRNSSPLFYSPSTDPSHAWPIIDRENISVVAPHVRRIGPERHEFPIRYWRSMVQLHDESVVHGNGPTSLIAAMRCFVRARQGEYTYVPHAVLERMSKHAPQDRQAPASRQAPRGG